VVASCVLYKVQTESLYEMEINFSLQRAKHGLMKLSEGKTKTTMQICRGGKETVLTQMQDEFFSLNLVLKYVMMS
jgi:hypothetical protein